VSSLLSSLRDIAPTRREPNADDGPRRDLLQFSLLHDLAVVSSHHGEHETAEFVFLAASIARPAISIEKRSRRILRHL
jgi:hypothetical protein